MGESWTVNSKPTLEGYIVQVRNWFDEHKYLTFPKPRIGVDRSIDQNSLFHLWCSQWIGYKLGKDYRRVEKAELAGMKRTVKKLYLIYNPDSAVWMIHEITDYSTGKKKKDYTSSSDWKTGEMFLVLNWIQLAAANDGLILESKGEHAKLTREAQS